MSNIPDPQSHGPEWRFAAFEGALAATRDWIRSVEKAVNTLTDSAPLTETSQAWTEMKERMKNVEHKVEETSFVALQTKNAVVGSYDDSGTVWRPGIREGIEAVGRLISKQSEDTDKVKQIGRWAVGVLTAIFVTVAIDLANSYLGLWGAAHAAIKITGGH